MDLSGVVIAMCALSLICVGVIIVGGFLVMRMVGGSMTDVLGGFFGGDNEEELTTAPIPGRRTPNFRAQSSSFDEALKRQQGNNAPSFGAQATNESSRLPRSNSFGDSPASSSGLGDIDPDMRSLRGRSRSSDRRRDDYEIYDDSNDGFFD